VLLCWLNRLSVVVVIVIMVSAIMSSHVIPSTLSPSHTVPPSYWLQIGNRWPKVSTLWCLPLRDAFCCFWKLLKKMLIFAAAEVAAEERDRVFFQISRVLFVNHWTRMSLFWVNCPNWPKRRKKESYWIQRREKNRQIYWRFHSCARYYKILFCVIHFFEQ